jgi:tRNA A-37 threonylcarbamoyl transferase component Bud32
MDTELFSLFAREYQYYIADDEYKFIHAIYNYAASELIKFTDIQLSIDRDTCVYKTTEKDDIMYVYKVIIYNIDTSDEVANIRYINECTPISDYIIPVIYECTSNDVVLFKYLWYEFESIENYYNKFNLSTALIEAFNNNIDSLLNMISIFHKCNIYHLDLHMHNIAFIKCSNKFALIDFGMSKTNNTMYYTPDHKRDYYTNEMNIDFYDSVIERLGYYKNNKSSTLCLSCIPYHLPLELFDYPESKSNESKSNESKSNESKSNESKYKKDISATTKAKAKSMSYVYDIIFKTYGAFTRQKAFDFYEKIDSYSIGIYILRHLNAVCCKLQELHAEHPVNFRNKACDIILSLIAQHPDDRKTVTQIMT